MRQFQKMPRDKAVVVLGLRGIQAARRSSGGGGDEYDRSDPDGSEVERVGERLLSDAELEAKQLADQCVLWLQVPHHMYWHACTLKHLGVSDRLKRRSSSLRTLCIARISSDRSITLVCDLVNPIVCVSRLFVLPCHWLHHAMPCHTMPGPVQ